MIDDNVTDAEDELLNMPKVIILEITLDLIQIKNQYDTY